MPKQSWTERWQRATASPWFVYVALVPLALILWGYVVQPVLATFMASVTTQDGNTYTLKYYLDIFSGVNQASLEALWGSVWISILSVIFCGIVGVGLAFLLSRYDFPGRRLLKTLALVPMALPPLVGVLTFVFLYSETGIIPRGLKVLFGLSQVPFYLNGIAGVVLVHAFTMYPYFYTAAQAALAGQDPSIEEAAYNLGASRWQVWTRVILPMLTPALVAGALLVFMISMASYTAPLLFGVDKAMTVQIANARTNGDLNLASAQSTILSVVSVAFLLIMRWYQGRRNYRSLSKGVSARRTKVENPVTRAVALVAATLAVIVLLLPVLTLILISFSKDGAWTIQVLPPKYTLLNYARLFTPEAWVPIKNSIEMSGLATIGDLLLGVAIAYVMARFTFKGKSLLDTAVMLPWALPGTVVAINLIAAFNVPNAFAFGGILVGTFWILPLAYFVRYLSLIFRSTSTSLAGLDPSLEEAARNLGATWWYGFRRVTLPLILPGVMGGALLAFVHGFGEFVSSILIYTPDSKPLSVAIFNHMYSFEYGTAAAYGVLQILLILVVLMITNRSGEDTRAGVPM